MTSTPKVSLICTVYNREKYLAQAIESVLAQTHKSWELVIWDDGSTDNSRAIAKSYAAKDGRIRVTLAAHQGRAAALQAAHDVAIGEYVGWIDSDDLLGKTAIARTVDLLDATPAAGMVYTDYRVINESGQTQRLGSRCRIPYSRTRLLTDFMTFHFRLIRRSCFMAIGGIDQDFRSAEDYDLCLRLSEITEVCHIPTPLYDYRVHPDSISVGDRATQTAWAKEAINRALVRRGLSDRLKLNVSPAGHFSIDPIGDNP
jgi:glycosyltransferase involved in cell wall biosynthesis